MTSCASVMIVIATILAPIAMVFMAVSFGTDYWLSFDVDRDRLSDSDKANTHNRYSHSRYRGLFRECYPGNESTFVETDPDVIDDYCFRIDYDMPENSSNYSDDYLTRLHLLRCWLAFYVVGLVVFVLAFIFGLVLCFRRVSRWGYLAALMAFISAFFVATAIAFFHGAEYMERNKLDGSDFYQQWPEGIKDATERSYDWSYAFGWVSVILGALTATFFAVAGCYISHDRYEDRQRVEKEFNRGANGGRDYPMYVMDPAMHDAPYMVKQQPMYPYAYNGPYIVAAPNDMSRYQMAESATGMPRYQNLMAESATGMPRYQNVMAESATGMPRYQMAESATGTRDMWNIREVHG